MSAVPKRSSGPLVDGIAGVLHKPITKSAVASLPKRLAGVSGPSGLRLVPGNADQGPHEVIAVDHLMRSRAARGETSIRVLIAAGQQLVRASYRALLETDERIKVIAEAASARQALALAAATTPDVALLDLDLPDLEDLESTAEIVSDPAFAGVAVMLIALRESDERILGGLRAGAIGVLSHDTEASDLIRALEVLASGQALLPAGAVRRLLSDLPKQSERAGTSDELDELTNREREVVALVGVGLTNREIAVELRISPATAKTHVSRAMVKLHARDRAKLVVVAYETGLVMPGSTGARPTDRPGALA
jgi:DNA-binding NarL/FixJ family response regulator